MAYRFKATEVASMKESILNSITNEDSLMNGEKTAGDYIAPYLVFSTAALVASARKHDRRAS